MRSGIMRRFALMGMALGLLALGLPARAAVPLTMQLEWIPSGFHAGAFLALQKGWCKDAGLEVTIADGTGSSTAVQLVANGKFDIGHASLSTMAFARRKGLPVIAIAGIFRKCDIGLMVAKASRFRAPKDLAGATIVTSPGSFEIPFVDAFLANGGLTRSQVHILSVDGSAKTSTFIQGHVDGVFVSAPLQMPLVEAKRPARTLLFSDAGLKLPSVGLFTTPAVLKAKGDAVRKFASIVAGAWVYIEHGHVDEATRAILALRPNSRINPKTLAEQIRESFDYLRSPETAKLPVGFQSDAEWALAIKAMETSGVIAKGSHPADYYTNAYLDRALIEKTSRGS